MRVITKQRRPWSLETLIEFVETVVDPFDDSPFGAQQRARCVNEALGTDRAQMYRWRRFGGLTDPEADRLAVQLGRHPCEIWPQWFAEYEMAS